MENFIVSARKYRPQNFESVVGQFHITTTLKNAIKNEQLAHAFLFCGPRGVGKTTCARILAKTINCENRSPLGEACNECASCVSFNRGSSLNIHELDAASNNSVEDIRNLVDQVRFAPQAGKYKVYIVDEVHMLSSAAFNAFLKTLEEPPSYAIFILATTEKHKIIPTILSRCQIFDFKRIQNEDTVEHLEVICRKENIDFEKSALHLIAQKSEGCLRDSLSLLDKIISFTNGKLSYENTVEHLNILDEDYFFRLIDAMQKQDLSEVLMIYHEINGKGFEGDQVLNAFSQFVRNLLVSHDSKVVALLEVAETFKKRYLSTAKTTDPNWLLSALNVLNESEIKFQQAKNKRLHVEMALIKLTFLGQALSLVQDGESVLKKKSLNEVRPVALKPLDRASKNDLTEGKSDNSTKLPPQSGKPGEPAPTYRAAEAKSTAEQPLKKAPAAPLPHVREPAGAENEYRKPEATLTIHGKGPEEGAGTTKRKANRVSSLSLEKIRKKVQEENSKNKILPLELQELQEVWDSFAGELSNNNNHSGAANFRTARLELIDEKKFRVIVDSSLHGKFIEGEKMELVSRVREYFNNRLITFEIEIRETKTQRPVEQITPREQLEIMKSNFPLVQTLIDDLELKLENF